MQMSLVCFFFCKQKTAYEMRISDWSSDVCSSDLLAAEVKDGRIVRISIDAASPFMVFEPAPAGVDTAWLMPALLISLGLVLLAAIAWPVRALIRRHYQPPFALEGRARRARSDERRVGKEWVSKCRPRWCASP